MWAAHTNVISSATTLCNTLLYSTRKIQDLLGSLRPTHSQENWHRHKKVYGPIAKGEGETIGCLGMVWTNPNFRNMRSK